MNRPVVYFNQGVNDYSQYHLNLKYNVFKDFNY